MPHPPPLDFLSASWSSSEAVDRLWTYQRAHNAVLRRYCELLGNDRLTFLPIEFFKSHQLKTAPPWDPQAIFESSGTTGQQPSRHYVRDLALYETITRRTFFHFFPRKRYQILALLPSYLERGNSSLVHMTQHWIQHFGTAGSGFYLKDFEGLAAAIQQAEEQVLLLGVSFALLDFSERFPFAFPQDAIVMETGGMKGRRTEMVRSELHQRLCEAFSLPYISSEYGMTELMSQAYALKDGRFAAPPWLKVVITDVHLPELLLPAGASGRINFIDLANVHSCAFIASDDIGRMHEDGTFEVLGRLDQAELRGCNLMYT